MAKKTRQEARKRRHQRVRSRVLGTRERPRLNVFRSLAGMYAQLIDDSTGTTLASASTRDPNLRKKLADLKKAEQAREVGEALAKRGLELGIKQVVFDRGGYQYIGRVKALADGARKGGLEF